MVAEATASHRSQGVNKLANSSTVPLSSTPFLLCLREKADKWQGQEEIR